MELKSKLDNLTFDLPTQKYKAEFWIDINDVDELEEFSNMDLKLTIKKWHSQRSLNQNDLAWKLIGMIAQKINDTPINVYKKNIYELGICDYYCVSESAKESAKKILQGDKIGRIVEELPSKIEGCVNLRVYKSSSDYDTAEMTKFIDGIVAECKELGINTEIGE